MAEFERQGELLERKPVDVAVDGHEGVRDLGHREAGPAQDTDHRVEVPEPGRPRRQPRLDDRAGPGVTAEGRVRAGRGPAELRAPIAAGLGDLVLRHDEVRDAVEHVLLALDLLVQGHRLHPQGSPEIAHRDGLDAALIRELQRRAQHPLARQAGPAARRAFEGSGHLPNP